MNTNVTYRWTKSELVRARSRGITLIELMIVVIVVAILGTVAVGSYRSQMIRANRTEARMALLRVQAAQEKFFLQNNRYASNSELAAAPPDGLGIPTTTPKGFYTISIENSTANTYTAVATAIGGQTRDAVECQRLTISHTGARTPSEASGCWR